jgi:hypothetical protein
MARRKKRTKKKGGMNRVLSRSRSRGRRRSRGRSRSRPRIRNLEIENVDNVAMDIYRNKQSIERLFEEIKEIKHILQDRPPPYEESREHSYFDVDG